MSQKELLEAISQQANLQTGRIAAESEEKAEAIVRKARVELDKISEVIVEQARVSMRSDQARIVNEARLQTKRGLLQAKHEIVERAMKGLKEKLAALPASKDFPGVFFALLDEALEGASGPVTIRCRKEDRKLAEEYAARAHLKATIVEVPFEFSGVEVLWGEHSEFIRKNSFQSRMEKIHPELLQEANRLIFSQRE